MTLDVIPSWSEIAAAKVAARDALIPEKWRIPVTDALNVIDIPKTCGVLSPGEIEITETPAPKLVQKILSEELSSYDVTLAFCKRAAIAQQLVRPFFPPLYLPLEMQKQGLTTVQTNCLTEIFFEEALKAAAGIDAEYSKSKTPLGPLHGLPVSLKDNFYIEGVDTTVGFVAWANDPAKKQQESEMTQVMRECGAVLFCKT